MGVRCGPVQRRGLLARDCTERRASLQQQLGGGEVAVLRRHVQRRVAMMAGRVHSRAVLEQSLYGQRAAGGGGEVERRLANIIHDVDLGARVLQQRRQGADRTHARAQMKSAQAQARTCE